MNRKNIINRFSVLVFTLVLPSLFQISAQEPPAAPVLINVNQIQLKPAMTDRFRALHLEQTMPGQRASGMPWRLTQANVFGDSFQLVISTPIQNFAELDDDAFSPTESGTALFGSSVEWRKRFVVQLRPELGIPGGQGVLPLRRMVRIQVKQGNIPEFEEFWSDTIIPALTRGGTTGYQVFQTVIGGSQGEYFGSVYIPDFAALDSLDIANLLNARQQAEFGALVDEFEVTLVRIDQELSYGLPNLQP